MKNQKFGIEIEMTGLTRERAANIVAAHFGTTAYYAGAGYSTWVAKDNIGRTWKLMSDASITAQGGEQVELVSPICVYEDIETIQEIIRKLRSAGAKTNDSCGIHVHIDAAPHTAQSLRNIANIMASKEDLLFNALDIKSGREYYCKKADAEFIDRVNAHKPKSITELQRIWYNGHDESDRHYSDTRYRALNLHAVFSKGTVEFRLFNSTTHAGKIKAYIQLCLAISRQALTQRSATAAKTQTTNAKYTFRTWLLRLGMIGDEYATARQHLLANLEGDIAFRNGRAA